MYKNFKQYGKLLIQFISFWVIAMSLFTVFRYLGMDQASMVSPSFAESGNAVFFEPLFPTVVLGVCLGIFYASIDFFFERYMEKRMALGVSIVVRTFIYFISTLTIITLIIEVSSPYIAHNFNIELGWWITDKRFWAVAIYIILAAFVHNFLRIATERFGKGTFVKILFGKYRKPREEKRIFMFLDLKGATEIAERIGHFLYSQFLQDCFYDLNEILSKYEAEIYQYVGDEAVLSWSFKKGAQNHNCIAIFFAFENQIHSKKDYYMAKYGVIPKFKAGLHGGTLMAAEVGFVKKELAYHGDVINTSARLQAECNKQRVSLILSNELFEQINIEKLLVSKFLGKVNLKGKKEGVGIHAVYGLITN
jgi:adenylate cyclase